MGRAAGRVVATGLLLILLLAPAAAAAGELQAPADTELPGNRLVPTVPVTSPEEAAAASQLVSALATASRELVTGEVDNRVVAYSQPEGVERVDVQALATRVLATALVRRLGQLGAHAQGGRQP